MKGEKYWEDLGRRAVACEGWRWMPGMLARYSGGAFRVIVGGPEPKWLTPKLGVQMMRETLPSKWPEFRDPATVGCLLAIVRELYGSYAVVARCAVTGDWFVASPDCDGEMEERGHGKTEAEALVAALEQVKR